MFVGPVASSSAQVIRAIACATSLVRGLTAHTPVVAHSIDAVTLRNTITRIADSDTAGLPIAGSTATLQLLGVLGPGDDLRAIWHSQYSTDAAAQYDPAAKILYVRESNGHYTPLDRAIISREYVNALQDQNFGLTTLLSTTDKTLKHNSDALLAREALVDGDAFITMLYYAQATFTKQDLFLLNQQLQQPSKPIVDYAHDEIGFPTAQGNIFVRALMTAASKGKQGAAAQAAGFAAVNQALRNPPATTLEVINPALYIQHSYRADSTVATPTVTMGAEWAEIDSDVLGAFGITDLLGQHKQPAPPTALQIAKQWQSDRWLIYQRGNNDTMLLWHARFTAPADAQSFLRAMTAYTASRFHATISVQTRMNWHTSGYCIAIRQRGNEIAMAISANQNLLDLAGSALTNLGFP